MSPQRNKASVRAWQRMVSGRRLDLLDPSPFDIEIEDIAHGLARVARWNGQTLGDHAFSVAQHSLIVEELVARSVPDPRWRLAALLHDAPEYVIGDMISPFKTVLGGNYREVEARLQSAIHLRFALPSELPGEIRRLIKSADTASAREEAVRLAGFSMKEADRYFGDAEPFGYGEDDFVPKPATVAERAFLDRFRNLDAELPAPADHDPGAPS